jgi:hypothetical protein
MHTTPLDTLVPTLPSDGEEGAATSARSLGTTGPARGTGLAFGTAMLRTLALVLACVFLAASPAVAKKRHAAARGHAHAAKKSKHAAKLARGRASALSTRVAAVDTRPTLTETRAPTPRAEPTPAPRAEPTPVATPAPSPPVEHGPLGPQAGDDEVPGSRTKR